MEWLKRLGAAIDYIEENLDKEISYDEAAHIACCSTYYFQRIFSEESLEETVSRCIEYELLHKAISKLPETQRRRLLLYFFGELSYEQIAKLEGCTKMAVKGSVDIALKKLKKLFEKF